jgi:hypothetical protein
MGGARKLPLGIAPNILEGCAAFDQLAVSEIGDRIVALDRDMVRVGGDQLILAARTGAMATSDRNRARKAYPRLTT